jgi:muramoyltetrapeptide carboxypeptidase
MIIPEKLKKNDEIRILSPALSMSFIGEQSKNLAKKALEELGFKVTFSENIDENDLFDSSSIESRVADIHKAFSDKNVKAIFTAIGGFNSNELLRYLDYDLIKNNPKIFCGFSDITALSNAIFKKSQLVTYSGPCFSMFAMQKYNEYWLEYFKKCLMSEDEFEIMPSTEWDDSEWYLDQENRKINENEGYWIINKGKCEGTIIGGNLCTLNLLQGTEYMPSLKDVIIFIEDDYESNIHFFNRNLQSLIHQPNFNEIKGIVIGRFQEKSKISRDELIYIIRTKKELFNIPIIANLDFGHTNPLFTFPIGGTAHLKVDDDVKLKIIKH